MLQCLSCKLTRTINLARECDLLLNRFPAKPNHLQLRVHARHEFSRAEWLREIVVRAGIDSLDACLFSGSCRQHDYRNDRRCRILPQGRQQGKTVHLRHHDIRKHQICRAALGLLKCNSAVRGRYNLKPTSKQSAQILPHVGVVICQDDHRLSFRCAASTVPSSRSPRMVPVTSPFSRSSPGNQPNAS